MSKSRTLWNRQFFTRIHIVGIEKIFSLCGGGNVDEQTVENCIGIDRLGAEKYGLNHVINFLLLFSNLLILAMQLFVNTFAIQ